MNWQAKSADPPPGYRYGGSYRPSLLNVLRAIVSILKGKPRSFARDALLGMRDVPIAPLVRGGDNIPEGGPLVIVANHYERPGLWMAWPALLMTAALQFRTGMDTHWIAIQEWESFSLFGVPIPPPWIRAVFERAFGAYGILAMAPPTAPAAARATSMRQAVATMKDGGVIGLMPEGTVGPTPELLPAREGAGAFLLLLASTGAPILPVGIYEENERLVLQFGKPFELAPPADTARSGRDAWARERVMHAIKAELPQVLWGAFRER